MLMRGVIFRATCFTILFAMSLTDAQGETERVEREIVNHSASPRDELVGRIIDVETLAVASEHAPDRNSGHSHQEIPATLAPSEGHDSRDDNKAGPDIPKLPLPPRRSETSDHESEQRSAARSPTWTIVSSLMIVVGLFLVMVWGTRRHLPQAATPLPDEVVRVLGRSPLAHRQTMQLVRIGNKLVLLCVTPQGAETLAEITDPAYVEQLTACCDPSRPDSMSAAFRHVLAQVGDHRSESRFSHGVPAFENSYSGRIRD